MGTSGSRSASAIGAALCALAAIAAGGAAAVGAETRHAGGALPGLPNGAPVAVETVYFGDRRTPVRVMRGAPSAVPATIRPAVGTSRPPAAPPAPQSTQIVSFGSGFVEQVTVVRGGLGIPAKLAKHPAAAAQPGIEHAVFVTAPASPGPHGVTVLRGAAIRELFSIDLFGPADAGELGRIAFAVDGVESRHGADARMWRDSLTGPQGPMQVSAAAALDVGGGDRFDIGQNRLLGRAYLAQMYRRYGNWQDALAAYNWGPGNMDLWIAGGRAVDRLPAGVAYYVARVLRDALVTAAR